MLIASSSGVRNDLLQEVADKSELPYGNTGMLPIALNWNDIMQGSDVDGQVATYTVPADKVAIVSGISLSARVEVVTGTTGTSDLSISITPNGGGAVEVARLEIDATVANERADVTIPCAYHLVEGDEIEIFSARQAGEEVYFSANVSIQESDV